MLEETLRKEVKSPMGKRRSREERERQVMSTVRQAQAPLSAHQIKINCRLQAKEYIQILCELVERGLLEIRADKRYIVTSKGSEYLRESEV